MKKNSISRKVLSMILAASILISLLPFDNIFAEWTTPNNITINDSTGSGEVAYFANQFGTPQQTNLYYVAGQADTIAYCIDAEATGPGGTAYSINDSAIDATFRNGLARIAQYGYPTNSWSTYGISATEAQYATQAAMHWWENAVFGGNEGWIRTGVVNNGSPTNFAGTLSYADWLLWLAGSSISPVLYSKITSQPTAWSNAATPTSTFNVSAYDSDYWILSLPAGVTSGGVSTISGSGNQNITVQLTNAVAFAASSKKMSVQGYSNRTEGQIHYYVAGGGYQNMIIYQQSVSAAGDPSDANLSDATGTLSLYKQTQWTTGVTSAEAGATFQVYNSAAIVVAIITTDASGNASVDLPYGNYTIHQVSGPGYTVNAPDQVYTVSASSPTATFTNIVYTGQIEINKIYAAQTGTVPEGGAVFQIFPNGSSYAAAGAYQRDQITTTGSGYAISKSLPYGTYTMVQTAAPIGSRINGTSWAFVLGADGATFINGDIDTVNISNAPTTGKLEISKTTNRGYFIPESGAIFEVYSTAYASYAAAPAALKDTLTTNGIGTDITKDLPYGNYRIHQSGMPAGTIAVADSTVTLGATDGATVHRDLVNTVYWGQIEVNKTTSYAGNVKLEAGAQFQIYSTAYASYAAAPTAEKATITTNASGYAISKLMPYGIYTMSQTVAPTGTQRNATVWTFQLGIDGVVYLNNDVDTQNVINIPNLGKLEIAKITNRGYSVAEAGAVFEVYSTDYASYAVAPDEYKDTLTTSASGTAISKDLPYGVYSIHQTVVPEGTIAMADRIATIGAVNGVTIHRNLVNEVYWGQAEIIKSTELAGNVKLEAGAAFQIYNTAYASYEAAPAEDKDTIITDANGHARSKLLPYGTYTAAQTVAPVGAQLNTGTWTFVLGIDGTTYVSNDVDTENIVNLPTFAQLELSKTTNRGFSVDEEGAAFEIYCTEYASFAAAPAEYKDTITTDINGDAVTKLLPYGEYMVHQSAAPAGTKAVADYKVSLEIAQGTVVHQDLVNETFWGDIQVLKYKIAPSISGVSTPEADATFRIYPSVFATWEEALTDLTPAQQDVLLDEIASDMGGVALTNHQLPYGEYTVEQIDTLANLYTFKVDAWQVFVGEADDQTYTYVRNNEIYEQYLAVIKTDAETGQVIRLTGATFEILAADGFTVLAAANGDNSFVTDANGRIDIFGMALQVGNYFIRETAAPKGYVLNTDLKAFAVSIADHGSSIVTIDYGVDIRSEFFTDTAQTCQLIVEKQGEVLTSATLIDAVNADTGARYSDEEGTDLSIYDFAYSLTGKVGAVFEVFVGEKDISDNAGLLKTFDKDGDGAKETELTADTSLGRITTAAVLQKDGTIRYIASMAGLPLDAGTGTAQYVLREVTAPLGDLINSEPLTYDFSYADQTIAQIDQEQSITDARQKVQVTVEKKKEAGTWNNDTKLFDWPHVAAPEILFGLFTSTDILAPDGSVLVATNTLVDVLYTDAAGVGKVTQDLPMGSYYAKELNVTSDVVYDSKTEYPVTAVPTSDQVAPTAFFVLNDGKAIINRQIAGTMEIFKYASDSNLPMPGVVFEVYDLKGNLVDTVTTGADGTSKTRVLPYARYTLLETKTITGYALAERTSFSIWIMPKEGETYSTSEMTIVDQKMAQIEVYKLTGDGTTTPMDGVVFGVYDAKTDAIVNTLTTDISGYGMTYVLKGNYYLMELHTWNGFALMPGKISVNADWAAVYTYRETNFETTVTLTKTDINTSAGVAGAEITIFDSAGKEVSKTFTDKKGQTTIKALPAGTYTFRETEAPTGYVINTTTFSFTIDQYGKVTGQTSIADNPTSLLIKKTSTISDTGLQGTQFTVTDAVTMELINVVWSETLQAYVPSTATVLGATRDLSPLTTLTTGADGTATVLYLPVSTYIVAEIKAPAGYNLDSKPTNVKVTSDSTGVLSAAVTIKNSPIIPKTGEVGDNTFLIIGICCLGLAISATIIVTARRTKRK